MTKAEWTQEDDAELKRLHETTPLTIAEIANSMGRDEDDVLFRSDKLGLITRFPHPF